MRVAHCLVVISLGLSNFAAVAPPEKTIADPAGRLSRENPPSLAASFSQASSKRLQAETSTDAPSDTPTDTEVPGPTATETTAIEPSPTPTATDVATPLPTPSETAYPAETETPTGTTEPSPSETTTETPTATGTTTETPTPTSTPIDILHLEVIPSVAVPSSALVLGWSIQALESFTEDKALPTKDQGLSTEDQVPSAMGRGLSINLTPPLGVELSDGGEGG